MLIHLFLLDADIILEKSIDLLYAYNNPKKPRLTVCLWYSKKSIDLLYAYNPQKKHRPTVCL